MCVSLRAESLWVCVVQTALSNSEALRLLRAVRPSDELFEQAGVLTS